MTVLFIDAASPPAIVPPGRSIASPAAYSAVLALSKSDLVAALGVPAADSARPVDWDPWGNPTVWMATP